eukprot:351776-Chlamydomonas_euryale.AAC.6
MGCCGASATAKPAEPDTLPAFAREAQPHPMGASASEFTLPQQMTSRRVTATSESEWCDARSYVSHRTSYCSMASAATGCHMRSCTDEHSCRAARLCNHYRTAGAVCLLNLRLCHVYRSNAYILALQHRLGFRAFASHSLQTIKTLVCTLAGPFTRFTPVPAQLGIGGLWIKDEEGSSCSPLPIDVLTNANWIASRAHEAIVASVLQDFYYNALIGTREGGAPYKLTAYQRNTAPLELAPATTHPTAGIFQ